MQTSEAKGNRLGLLIDQERNMIASMCTEKKKGIVKIDNGD